MIDQIFRMSGLSGIASRIDGVAYAVVGAGLGALMDLAENRLG
jgi:hypothetical protein